MNQRYAFVAQRAGHRCEYCRAPEVIFNFHFEVEHIVPVSQNGGDELSNLALACRSCNSRKSDQTAGRDDITGGEALLYHPREHNWDDHFEIDGESGVIRGKTTNGRATVSLLQINNVDQLAARKQWMRLALFP